jgi:hypothetical protein
MADNDPKKSAGAWLEMLKVVTMPVVTIVLGFVLNASLNTRQISDSRVRLYVDMMGRREEADAGLRRDMFTSTLNTFLKKDTGLTHAQAIEQDVLNLELLAYNFDETLNLGPLFKHVQREVSGEKTNQDKSLLRRLEKVAGDVKERQISALADGGAVERGDLKIDTEVLTFGRQTVPPGENDRRAGPTLCLSIGLPNGGRDHRQFKIKFIDYNDLRREVELDLAISRPLEEPVCKTLLPPEAEQANTETEAQFWVGLFAFPMIDNTRLSNSERCSISVTRVYGDGVDLALSYFPASRASLKDKAYYDEIIHNLLPEQSVSKSKGR